MTDAKLRVEISADIQQLERALTSAEKLLVQHQNNYDAVSRSIGEASRRMGQIGREAQGLKTALNAGKITTGQYDKEMSRLGNTLRAVDREISDLQREQARLNREMQRASGTTRGQSQGYNQVGTSARNASKGMQQMSRTATVNAVPAMTSVSQIVQDMPYGIQGVANNIQQLTMQMGWLTTQAGGTKNAFRELAGSLWGPAGLLLAVSVVTSLMVSASGEARTYGQILLSLSEKTDKVTKSFRELAKANRESISQIQAEVTQAQILMGIIDDENETRDRKLEAIKGVNDIMPEALKNFSDEAILAGEAAEQIDRVTGALERMARMQNLRTQISEVYEEIAKIEDTLREGRDIEGAGWLDALKTSLTNVGFGLGTTTKSLIELNRIGTKNLNEDLDEANEKSEALMGRLQEVINEALDAGDYSTLGKGIEDALEKAGRDTRIPVTPVLDAEGIQAPEESFTKWATDQLKELEALRAQAPLLSEDYANLTKQIEVLRQRLSTGGWLFAVEGTTDGLRKLATESTVASNEISDAAKQMNRAMEMAIQGMIKSMLDGKFEAADFAKSILASFLSIGVNSLLGGGGFLSGLFGGGSQMSIRTPSVNTSAATRSIGTGSQLGVAVDNIRIDGQDLLVVMGRAEQRNSRIG